MIEKEQHDFFFNYLNHDGLTYHKILNVYYLFLLDENCTSTEISHLTLFGESFILNDYQDHEGDQLVLFTYGPFEYYRMFSWRALYITMMRLLCKQQPHIFQLPSDTSIIAHHKDIHL